MTKKAKAKSYLSKAPEYTKDKKMNNIEAARYKSPIVRLLSFILKKVKKINLWCFRNQASGCGLGESI